MYKSETLRLRDTENIKKTSIRVIWFPASYCWSSRDGVMCSSDDELERTANSIAALKRQMELACQKHESQMTGYDIEMVELQTIHWVRERRARRTASELTIQEQVNCGVRNEIWLKKRIADRKIVDWSDQISWDFSWFAAKAVSDTSHYIHNKFMYIDMEGNGN